MGKEPEERRKAKGMEEQKEQASGEQEQKARLQEIGRELICLYAKRYAEKDGEPAPDEHVVTMARRAERENPQMVEILERAFRDKNGKGTPDDEKFAGRMILQSIYDIGQLSYLRTFFQALDEEELEDVGKLYLMAVDILTYEGDESLLYEKVSAFTAAGKDYQRKVMAAAGYKDKSGEGLKEPERGNSRADREPDILEVMKDRSFDNTKDTELWKMVEKFLGQLVQGVAAGLMQDETDESEKEVSGQENRKEPVGEDTYKNAQRVTERVRTTLRVIDPRLVRYFLYRAVQWEIQELEGPILSEQAQKNGLKGKRAQKYVDKRLRSDLEQLDDQYAAYQDFFASVTRILREAWKIESSKSDLQNIPRDSFAWVITFFSCYDRYIGEKEDGESSSENPAETVTGTEDSAADAEDVSDSRPGAGNNNGRV